MATQTEGLQNGCESIVSYLPLSHIAAQLLDIYIPMMHAASVYFAQPDALKVWTTITNSTVKTILTTTIAITAIKQQ